MKVAYLIIFAGLLAVMGCKKALKDPETADLIFLDLKKESEATLAKVRQLRTEVEAERLVWEKAPIRTGERQDAADTYNDGLHQLQKLEEKYRYLAVKTELRLKYVRKVYPEVYAENKPWPDEEEYRAYMTQKHLHSAPKEWSPEYRIKERQAASQKKAAPAAAEHSSEH